MKYREIAERLGISAKTVEAQMSKALRILRVKLAEFLPVLFLFLISIQQ
jgi:RNA polymerase sigma-70 factor (ECF subfamily)